MSGYQQFCDSLYWKARSWIVPDLLNSQYAYRDSVRGALESNGTWLDLGCGHDFLPPWFSEAERRLDTSRWRVVGLDLDRDALARHASLQWRVESDVHRLPFASETFELVTANMVVEHVARPESLFNEVKRVLRPNGRFILHTPNAHGYSTALTRMLPSRLIPALASALLDRAPEDVYPTFYRANTGTALRSLAENVGLAVESLKFVDSTPQLIRIPPAMFCELSLIRLMRACDVQSGRACIVSVFRK